MPDISTQMINPHIIIGHANRGGYTVIVNKKTKAFLTRSDKPCENWTDQDCYIIDDNSELAKKIKRNYPNIEYVIENEQIIDVKILEPQPKEKEITPAERLSALESAVLELAIGGKE